MKICYSLCVMLENQFPNFKKVDISDKEIFLEILHGLPSYSDFNLLSLLSWNADGNNAYSLLNNNIVIRIKDYLGTGENYSIIGTTKIPESVESLISNFSKLNFVHSFFYTIVTKLGIEHREDIDMKLSCEVKH